MACDNAQRVDTFCQSESSVKGLRLHQLCPLSITGTPLDKRPCCSCVQCISMQLLWYNDSPVHHRRAPEQAPLLFLRAVHYPAAAFGIIPTLLLILISFRAPPTTRLVSHHVGNLQGFRVCICLGSSGAVAVQLLSITLRRRSSRRITPLPRPMAGPQTRRGCPLRQQPCAVQLAAVGDPPVPQPRQSGAAATARPAAAARCAPPLLLHRLGRPAAATRSGACCSAVSSGALWPLARQQCLALPRRSCNEVA